MPHKIMWSHAVLQLCVYFFQNAVTHRNKQPQPHPQHSPHPQRPQYHDYDNIVSFNSIYRCSYVL